MKTIYLIRHGHVDNPDHVFYDEHFPLSETGAHEASELARDVKEAGCHPARIVSSPYLRTRETAHIISTEISGPEVEYDDRVKEWQVGEWFLKPITDFRNYVGYDKKPFQPNTEGMESFESIAARMREAVQSIVASIPEDGCALIVSHREPMTSLILSLQGEGWERIPELDFPKGSSWKLVFEDDGTFRSAEKTFDRSSPASKNSI